MIRWIQNNPMKTILFTGIMIFFNLHVVPVGIMEARNFVTAREMATHGHWVLTTMNEIARYEKPPLPTWLTAISGMLFGMKNIFALRAPAALMAIGVSFIMYILSLRLTSDKKQSLLNALILITSFYIIAIIYEAPVDIYAHGFMLTGIYFLFLLLQEDRNLWRNSIVAAFFTACSILSKGPVALYGLFLPYLISYGIAFRFTNIRMKILPLTLFIIASMVMGGWWYVYVRLADPTSFSDIVAKETTNWVTYHVKPFYYYWNFFLQTGVWAIPAVVSLLYPYLKARVMLRREYYFSLLWTLLAVFFLSIIPEKKPRYLVPVLIPLAINTGFYIHYLIHHFKNKQYWFEKLPVYFSFGLIAVSGATFPVVVYYYFGHQLHGVLWHFCIMAIALLIISVLLFRAMKSKEIEEMFFLTVSFVVTIMLTGLPILKNLNVNNSFNNISKLSTANERIKIYSFSELAPEIIWHYGSPIPTVADTAHQILAPKENIYGVLVAPADEGNFSGKFSPVGVLEFIETFDLNYNANPGQKTYSTRLVYNYYLIESKGSINVDIHDE